MLSKFLSLFKKSNVIETGAIFVPKQQMSRKHVVFIKSESGYIRLSRNSNHMLEKVKFSKLPQECEQVNLKDLPLWMKTTVRTYILDIPKFEEGEKYLNQKTGEVISIEIVKDFQVVATKEDGTIIRFSPLTINNFIKQ